MYSIRTSIARKFITNNQLMDRQAFQDFQYLLLTFLNHVYNDTVHIKTRQSQTGTRKMFKELQIKAALRIGQKFCVKTIIIFNYNENSFSSFTFDRYY